MKNNRTDNSAISKLSLSDFGIRKKQSEFVQELFASLSEFGFAIIVDHDIPSELLARTYDLSAALFDLPSEIKAKYQIGRGGQRAYTAFGNERAKGSQFSDLKEFWHIGPELSSQSPYYERYPNNLWPSELIEFKPIFIQLYDHLQNIAVTLLHAIGLALDVDKKYFPNLVEEGNSILRLIHYPAVESMDIENRMRAAPHADINLMTLLVGASDSGLQLLDSQNEWVDIETQPNEIVIDTGDMMALLTGGQLPATVHRVINPADERKARYSMPFFLHPHADAKLTCLPQFRERDKLSYPVITADAFLQQRLRENGLIN